MTFSRRDFLFGALGAFTLPALLPRIANAMESPVPGADAGRSLVLVWLNGGPSQLDTFDPKPGTANGGTVKGIDTRIKGVQFASALPRLAERADRLAVIRSMRSREGNHERASYFTRTGYLPLASIEHPTLGAVLSKEREDPSRVVPSYVSIGRKVLSAGFLGPAYDPFQVPDPTKPSSNLAPRPMDERRAGRRERFLERFTQAQGRRTDDAAFTTHRAYQSRALSTEKSAFFEAADLTREPAGWMQRYGEHTAGAGCLMARRLLDVGVRAVEVSIDGWDTHEDNFDRSAKLAGDLDAGVSGLLDDLKESGRIRNTTVVVAGEFGRTPKINPREGRDHFPQAYCALLAGAGVKGGVAVGATDANGTKVVERPVAVPDLLATVLHCVGISNKTYISPGGRPIVPGGPGTAIGEVLL